MTIIQEIKTLCDKHRYNEAIEKTNLLKHIGTEYAVRAHLLVIEHEQQFLRKQEEKVKSKAELMKEMRARRAKDGLTHVNGIWAPPQKHREIKAFLAKHYPDIKIPGPSKILDG